MFEGRTAAERIAENVDCCWHCGMACSCAAEYSCAAVDAGQGDEGGQSGEGVEGGQSGEGVEGGQSGEGHTKRGWAGYQQHQARATGDLVAIAAPAV
jgi:hypothetical protein